MNFEEYMNSHNNCEWEEDDCEYECECECECHQECDCHHEYDCRYEQECECEEKKSDDPECIVFCPDYKRVPDLGMVEVYSHLNCTNGEPISGMPFNLYKIDRNGEKLIASKKTDKRGRVEFNCLENGMYRVQQVVDECVFDTPEYYPASEFVITDKKKHHRIYVVNKLRKIDKCLKRVIDKAAEQAVKRVLCKYARRCC
ncbi:MAG: SpaA isopeptide-forming pilin-related protein [Sarcina sp.]